MKDWRSVALIVLVSLILGRESAHTQPDRSIAATPVDPGNPISIRVTEPIPVILVAPVNPRPVPPTPVPGPTIDPTTPDTPLARTGRAYLRMLPYGLPEAWKNMADRIDRGEITDKAGAVHAHNQISSSLNSALDQVFAAGMDAKGKIINKDVIVIPLRQSAVALGRPD